MVEQEITICNKLGLHARASAKLVQLTSQFAANVFLQFRGREINAKSIMGLMLLAAGKGSTLVVKVDGADEHQALAAVIDLFQRKFDEGE